MSLPQRLKTVIAGPAGLPLDCECPETLQQIVHTCINCGHQRCHAHRHHEHTCPPVGYCRCSHRQHGGRCRVALCGCREHRPHGGAA